MISQVMSHKPNTHTPPLPLFTLAEIIVTITIIGLLSGAALFSASIIEVSQLQSQITQIQEFDEAVANFYNKFGGLPGDLLDVRADREGLPTGDGTPSHSDGDGKIAPCNLGWQNYVGCETALFWLQLSLTEYIPMGFGNNRRLADDRLESAGGLTLRQYIPESPLGEDIYVAVWNNDVTQLSPQPRLPYGNYFEVTRVDGIYNEKIIDDMNTMTPMEAHAVDKKIDDGLPMRGRIVVNGLGRWPNDTWGTFAKPGPESCVTRHHKYNEGNYFIARRPLCHLAIAFSCCEVVNK